MPKTNAAPPAPASPDAEVQKAPQAPTAPSAVDEAPKGDFQQRPSATPIATAPLTPNSVSEPAPMTPEMLAEFQAWLAERGFRKAEEVPAEVKAALARDPNAYRMPLAQGDLGELAAPRRPASVEILPNGTKITNF